MNRLSAAARRRAALVAMLAAGLFMGGLAPSCPPEGHAQGPCEAQWHIVNGRTALATGFYSSAHTGCDQGAPSGAATGCEAVILPWGDSNKFWAWWPSTAARTGPNPGGCHFECATGDCFVGHDGLPVELLSFGVE